MVNTISIASEDNFVEQLLDCEYNTLGEDGARELYDVWDEVTGGLTDDTLLVVVEDWLSTEKIDRRRPFFLGSVEYDSPDKAAVLFSELRSVDVSIFENEVLDAFLETAPERTTEDILEAVDVSGESDYIDEPGMLWIPRDYMQTFEQTH